MRSSPAIARTGPHPVRWAVPAAVSVGTVLMAGVAAQCLVAMSRPGLFAPGHNVPNAVIGVLGDGLGEILVGTVLAARLPKNPIGWLLLGFGASTDLLTGSGAIAQAGYGQGHPSLLAQASLVVGTIAESGLLVTILLVVALFPSGRAAGRKRQALVRALWLVPAVLTVPLLVSPTLEAGSGRSYPNPLGLSGTGFLKDASVAGTSLVFALFLFVVVVDTLIRWSRARGVERQQLRVFVYAAVAWVVVLVCGGFIPTSSAWNSVDWTVGSNLLASAIGVAVLRYRLYDLDRVVSRTATYAVVTGVLVGVYVGLVTFATRVLPFSSPVGVAASTLVAAALFNPLRRQVQHRVDRRFNRARYDADTTAAAFAERLRAAVEPGTVRQDFLAVLRATLEPEHVTLWVPGAQESQPL